MKQYEVRKDTIQIPFVLKAAPDYMSENEILEQTVGVKDLNGMLVLQTDDEHAARNAYETICRLCDSRMYGNVLHADIAFIRTFEQSVQDDGMHTITDEYGYFAHEFTNPAAKATDEDVNRFTYALMLCDDPGLLSPIESVADAEKMLDDWDKDRVRYPVGTEPEQLMEIWNENLEHYLELNSIGA